MEHRIPNHSTRPKINIGHSTALEVKSPIVEIPKISGSNHLAHRPSKGIIKIQIIELPRKSGLRRASGPDHRHYKSREKRELRFHLHCTTTLVISPKDSNQ